MRLPSSAFKHVLLRRYNRRMGKRIGSEFKCEFCRKRAVAATGNQRTCLSKACRLKLRSKNRKIKRRAERKQNPKECIWCYEPITQIGKREYHPECRADKNRERVRLYNANHKSTPGPKKSKKFRGFVRCAVCNKRVRRTGGKQMTCLDDVCRRARKQQTKKALRDAPKLIEEMRKQKEAAFHDLPENLGKRAKRECAAEQASAYIENHDRLIYQVGVGAWE